MELTEKIESINKQLLDHFGIDTMTSQPIWRVVWSEEQFEMRLGTYTDYVPNTKIYLRTVREVRKVPKYRQWIQEKYVLERLVVVPDFQQEELPTSKTSYEPIWVFEDKKGNYLPPKWEAAKFIIDTIYAAQYGNSMKKYVDEECNQEAAEFAKERRVDALVEELFGEQSALEGTTVTGESIIVPRNYERN